MPGLLYFYKKIVELTNISSWSCKNINNIFPRNFRIEFRKYGKIFEVCGLVFVCKIVFKFVFIFFFIVMILDDNMQKLKARSLGNIVVK